MSNRTNVLDLSKAVIPVESDGRKFVSKEVLAALTGMSPSTIERRRRDGRIEFWQPGVKGTRVLYPLDQLNQARVQAVEAATVADRQSQPPKPRSGPKPRWKRNPTI